MNSYSFFFIKLHWIQIDSGFIFFVLFFFHHFSFFFFNWKEWRRRKKLHTHFNLIRWQRRRRKKNCAVHTNPVYYFIICIKKIIKYNFIHTHIYLIVFNLNTKVNTLRERKKRKLNKTYSTDKILYRTPEKIFDMYIQIEDTISTTI